MWNFSAMSSKQNCYLTALRNSILRPCLIFNRLWILCVTSRYPRYYVRLALLFNDRASWQRIPRNIVVRPGVLLLVRLRIARRSYWSLHPRHCRPRYCLVPDAFIISALPTRHGSDVRGSVTNRIEEKSVQS